MNESEYHVIFHQQTSLSYMYYGWEEQDVRPIWSVLFTFNGCHVMSCHVMSCQVISYHIISYHIMSCQLTVQVEDWFYSHNPFTRGMLALHSFGRQNHYHYYRRRRKKERYGDEKMERTAEDKEVFNIGCCYEEIIIDIFHKKQVAGVGVVSKQNQFPVLVRQKNPRIPIPNLWYLWWLLALQQQQQQTRFVCR